MTCTETPHHAARVHPAGWAGWIVRAALLLSATSLQAGIPQQQSIDRPASVVVKLFGAGIGNLDSYGSGILISPEGHVVTVWNHLINTGYLTAVTADGQRFQLDVVGTSAKYDLAVLRLQHDGQQEFAWADHSMSVHPPAGSTVRAFSNMFRVATGNEQVSVVHGIIAAETRLTAGFGRWQFPLTSDVLILDAITNNSGAAGGLLTDGQGQPIGMLGRELRHNESGTWVNYAVPFDTLSPIIDTILSGRTANETGGAAETTPIGDRQLTALWGMTLLPDVLQETPAFIDRVVVGSPADTAGLRRGDLVVLVDDQVIQSGSELRRQLAQIRRGLPVAITVNRRGGLESVRLRAP